jgi:hypothetical protein
MPVTSFQAGELSEIMPGASVAEAEAPRPSSTLRLNLDSEPQNLTRNPNWKIPGFITSVAASV